MEGTKFPGSPFPMTQDIGWSPDCFFCEEAVISLLLLLSSIIVIVISAHTPSAWGATTIAWRLSVIMSVSPFHCHFHL